MEIIKIGQGYEPPLGDYSGIRIEENGISKFEVRISGTACALINNSKEIYGEVFDFVEQIGIAIYSTDEIDSFKVIMITSGDIGNKYDIIKNWRSRLTS